MKRIWIHFSYNHADFYGQVEEDDLDSLGKEVVALFNIFLLRQIPQRSAVAGADGRQMQQMGLAFTPFCSPIELKVNEPMLYNTQQFLYWDIVESKQIIETLAQSLLDLKQQRTKRLEPNPPPKHP